MPFSGVGSTVAWILMSSSFLVNSLILEKFPDKGCMRDHIFENFHIWKCLYFMFIFKWQWLDEEFQDGKFFSFWNCKAYLLSLLASIIVAEKYEAICKNFDQLQESCFPLWKSIESFLCLRCSLLSLWSAQDHSEGLLSPIVLGAPGTCQSGNSCPLFLENFTELKKESYPHHHHHYFCALFLDLLFRGYTSYSILFCIPCISFF